MDDTSTSDAERRRRGPRRLLAGLLSAVAVLVLGVAAWVLLAGDGGYPEGRAVVWAVGDGADGSSDARRVAEMIASRRPDLFLYLGDIYRYPDYTDEEEAEGEPEHDGARETEDPVEDNYARDYGALADITEATPGDHEWEDDRDEYLAWWREAKGAEKPAWYSVEVAGWKILILNSEEPVDEGSEQLEWLRDEVAEPGRCRIAVLHRPRFSAGVRHGDQDDLDPVWQALRGHASVVLSADDHAMQRLKPIDGMVQFVSGARGRSNYDVDDDDDRLAFSRDDVDGALRLDLSPGHARHAFVSVDGETLDSGEIRCRP